MQYRHSEEYILLDFLGFYNPTFFDLCLHTNNHETFVHEYIHYIQSITTTQGLMQYFYKNIYWLNEFIDKNNPLFEFVNEMCNNKKSFIKLMNNAIGDRDDTKYRDLKVEKINLLVDDKYYQAKLDLDVDGIKRQVILGSTIIKENMARLIQNQLFPKNGKPKIITYDLIEEVVKKHSPNFPITEQNIFALCDLSLLLSHNPAQVFFNILDYCKNYDDTVISSKFLYEHSEKSLIYHDIDLISFDNILNNELKMCFTAIEAFYISFNSEYTIEIINNIKLLFQKACKYRKENISFISDIMNEEITPFEAKIKFSEIHMKFGSPIIRTKDEILLLDEQFRKICFILLGIEQVSLKLLEKKSGSDVTCCGLKKICENHVLNDTEVVNSGILGIKHFELYNEKIRENFKKLHKGVVDDSCNAPLKRSRYTNICPFTYALRKFRYEK